MISRAVILRVQKKHNTHCSEILGGTMNLTTNNQELLAAMQKLATVVEKRQTMPVLGMVRIVATGNKAELTATDLEITAVATIDATVTSEGAVCIPDQVFHLFRIQKDAPVGVLRLVPEVKLNSCYC